MCSRILMSSSRNAENSFVPVYQFDFQSWMTPTRRPPGWIFWPIQLSASSVFFGFLAAGLRFGAACFFGAASAFGLGFGSGARSIGVSLTVMWQGGLWVPAAGARA